MAAAIAAARASLQMVSGGENDASIFINVEVRRASWHDYFLTDARKNLRRVIRVQSIGGKRSETTAAKAGGLELPFNEKAQHVSGHAGLFTPARSFVEAACSEATAIRQVAQRTALIVGES